MKKLIISLCTLISTNVFASVNLSAEPNSFSLFSNQTAYASSGFTVRITNDSDQEHIYRYKAQLCPDRNKCEVVEKWGIHVKPHQTFQKAFRINILLFYRSGGIYKNTANLNVTGITDRSESKNITETGYITLYQS